MSDNIYNVMSPILIDPNRYNVNDLKIEFKKNFLKSYEQINNNKINLGYHPVTYIDNTYLPVDFNMYDSTSYIKLKGQDLWLHVDQNNNFFFDIIREEGYYYRKPLIIWFFYNKDNQMVMYEYSGKGLAKINETLFGGFSNILYINYKQTDKDIYMEWTNDVNDATKILLDKVQWSDYVWRSKFSTDKDALL